MKKLKLFKEDRSHRTVARKQKSSKKSPENQLDWDNFIDFSLNTNDLHESGSFPSTSKLMTSSSASDKITSSKKLSLSKSNQSSSMSGVAGETMILSRRKSRDNISRSKNLSFNADDIPQTSTIMLPEPTMEESTTNLEDDGSDFLKRVSILTNKDVDTSMCSINSKKKADVIKSHYLMDVSENSESSPVNMDAVELFDADPVSADDRESQKKHISLLRTPQKNKSLSQHLAVSPNVAFSKNKSTSKIKPFTIDDLSEGMVQFEDTSVNNVKTLPLPEDILEGNNEPNLPLDLENKENLNVNDNNDIHKDGHIVTRKDKKRDKIIKNLIGNKNPDTRHTHKIPTKRSVSPHSAVKAYKNAITEIISPRRVLNMLDEPESTTNGQTTSNLTTTKGKPPSEYNDVDETIKSFSKSKTKTKNSKASNYGTIKDKIKHGHDKANSDNKELKLKNTKKRRLGEREKNDDNMLRRSKRHKVGALRYWENEYIDYKITEEGFVINRVIKNCQGKQTLSGRLEIKKPPQQIRDKVSTQHKFIDPSPFSILDPNTSTHEHHYLVWPRQLIKLNYKNISSKTPKLQTDTYLKYDNISVGQVILKPKAEKGLYLSKDHIIMHVLEGYGIVTIAKKQEAIASGTSLIIPKENVYNVQNSSSKRCLRMLFVISESQ